MSDEESNGEWDDEESDEEWGEAPPAMMKPAQNFPLGCGGSLGFSIAHEQSMISRFLYSSDPPPPRECRQFLSAMGLYDAKIAFSGGHSTGSVLKDGRSVYWDGKTHGSILDMIRYATSEKISSIAP